MQGFGTSEPGRTYTWDADNRLTAVSVQNPAPYNPSVWNFLYDPAGGRIEKSGPDGTIQYFGLAELVDGQLVQYYMAGNVLVARKAATDTTFYHADRLGSVRLMTDAAGNQVKTYEYASYGQTLTETGTAANEVGFTGQRRDVGTGLIYMGARYYDAQLGQFISPDTVLPDVYDPQALNRYAYALNNPVNNTDPTGHTPIAVMAVSIALSYVHPCAGSALALLSGNPIMMIGAGLSIAGYFADNPLISTVGAIMMGYAGGEAIGGTYGIEGMALAHGIVGASVAAFTSPLSPVDGNTKQAVGWAWSAYGLAVATADWADKQGQVVEAAQASQGSNADDLSPETLQKNGEGGLSMAKEFLKTEPGKKYYETISDGKFDVNNPLKGVDFEIKTEIGYNSKGDQIRGVTQGGRKITIYLDGLTSPEEAASTILHELAHVADRMGDHMDVARFQAVYPDMPTVYPQYSDNRPVGYYAERVYADWRWGRY